jgi:hypothetical protein
MPIFLHKNNLELYLMRHFPLDAGMSRSFFSITAHVLSLLCVAEMLLVGAAHHHCCDLQPNAERRSVASHACCAAHDHCALAPATPDSRRDDGRPLEAPHRDQDQCLTCRVLAERPLPVELAELPEISQSLGVAECRVPSLDIPSLPTVHHSRAPPA